MKAFDTEAKIDENLKQLNFYYDLSSKLQGKISVLVVFYSFIFFYLIELVKYLFSVDFNIKGFFYVIFFFAFMYLFVTALFKAYHFFKPVDIAYLHDPKYYYEDVLTQYKNKLETDDEALLTEYINLTYLKEVEISLQENTDMYREKSNLFYDAFVKTLQTLVIYIFLSSFVLYENRDKRNEFEIQNYQDIINYLNATKMSEGKPKVDPKMIITTQPIRVKQGADSSGSPIIKPHISTSKSTPKPKGEK